MNILTTVIASYNSVGNLVWDVEYDIFGNIRSQSKGDKDFIPFRNQGQYEDAEVNLFYNRYRYYSPKTGTYISQDPIGLFSGEDNFYAYVYDSNSLVDIFGLKDCTLSDLDKKSIDAWDTLPDGKGKNMTTVAVGKGESGQLYVSTSKKYTPKVIQDWAKQNNIKVVSSKQTDIHAEESLHNFSGENMVEIGSSKPICLDCEKGMKKNNIDFNNSNTKGKKSKKRQENGSSGTW